MSMMFEPTFIIALISILSVAVLAALISVRVYGGHQFSMDHPRGRQVDRNRYQVAGQRELAAIESSRKD